MGSRQQQHLASARKGGHKQTHPRSQQDVVVPPQALGARDFAEEAQGEEEARCHSQCPDDGDQSRSETVVR